MEDAFKRVVPKISKKVSVTRLPANVSISNANKIDPYKFNKFTTKPSEDRLAKQIVYGLKPVVKNTNVEGYKKSSGNKRFNTNKLKWKNVTNNAYVKNEFSLRPENVKPLPKNINISETLYGYKPRRNQWVPRQLLNKAAAIPFVGLKK